MRSAPKSVGRRSWLAAGAFACLALTLAGCGEHRVGETATATTAAGQRVSPADQRMFEGMEDFLNGYWLRPVPAQGPAPAHFDSLTASLHPAACGVCHANQYRDWKTTIHARAYSPGLSGQLVNWEEGQAGTVRSCQACHTPLSEQIARLPGPDGEFAPNPDFDRALRNQGLVCAACHVRGNLRYGPPRRDGSLESSAPHGPHGGVRTRTTYFEDSRFCASCHQFAAPAPNGKSLQNTFREWEESRYATEGVSCQRCHMPDRRHLWRGIHDPEMVADGVTIEWVRTGASPDSPEDVGVAIHNTGTGHHFPTYVTPEVVVEVWLETASGETIAGSETTSTIGRQVKFEAGVWVEETDTRIPADSTLMVTTPQTSAAATARARVTVLPDEFYRNTFDGMLSWSLSDTSRVLIEQAHEEAATSRFAIFDQSYELSSGRILEKNVSPAALGQADTVVGVGTPLDVAAVARATEP